MASVYLQLGANLGERADSLASAVQQIEARIGPVLLASKQYETPAWGLTDQPDFLNQVILVDSALDPWLVLQTILDIEKNMGRQRKEKWGPRLIDIDILGIDDLIIDSPDLTIPHPWLHRRLFVLEPFAEIAPHWVHPILLLTVKELLDQLLGEG